METRNRFCRSCCQTTPYRVRKLGDSFYECNACKKSRREILKGESKKEDKKMDLDEMMLRILEEKGTATASEISAEMNVPVEDVNRVLARLETAGLLLLVM